jgi:hypothetical protein
MLSESSPVRERFQHCFGPDWPVTKTRPASGEDRVGPVGASLRPDPPPSPERSNSHGVHGPIWCQMKCVWG